MCSKIDIVKKRNKALNNKERKNCSTQTTLKRAHCNENPIHVFLLWEFMCLRVIYIFLGSVYIFSCKRIGRSLTDTWMWKMGLSPRNSFVSNFRDCFFAVRGMSWLTILASTLKPSDFTSPTFWKTMNPAHFWNFTVWTWTNKVLTD